MIRNCPVCNELTAHEPRGPSCIEALIKLAWWLHPPQDRPQDQGSVQPDWCRALPFQQQSVLFLAARGPDGFPKKHPVKVILAAYRGAILKAGKYGRLLHWGEKADGFMTLDVFADGVRWAEAVKEFFQHSDALPHHFFTHLMHGTQIVGYHHPEERYRDPWLAFYLLMADSMHLPIESKETMDARLSDWNKEHWQAPTQTAVCTCHRDDNVTDDLRAFSPTCPIFEHRP